MTVKKCPFYRGIILSLFSLAFILVFIGCGNLNKNIVGFGNDNKYEHPKKAQVNGGWEYNWDQPWRKYDVLSWHEGHNYLYIDEERGLAKGVFGRVENHHQYYHIKPIYKFSVIQADGSEKKFIVRMGIIEDETLWAQTEFLEECWSEKIIFEPGSKVIEGTVVRGYEVQYLDMPSKCSRKSPPY